MTTDIASLCINGATSVLRNIYTRQANILRTKCLYVEGPRAQCRGAGPKSAPTQVPVTLPGTSYFLTSMEKLISEILGHTNRQAATHLTRGGAAPNAKWHTSQIIRGPHAGPFTFHQNLQLGALGRILKRQADLWGGSKPSRALGPALARPGFTPRIRWERRMPVFLQGPCLALYWHCTQAHHRVII